MSLTVTLVAHLDHRHSPAPPADHSPAPPFRSQRVWFLPIEWVDQSYKAKKLLPEAEHDFEKLEVAKREARAEELAEERKQHGGKSIYARGERQKLERQRRMVSTEA